MFSENTRKKLAIVLCLAVVSLPMVAQAVPSSSSLQELIAKQELLRKQILSQQKAAQAAQQKAQQLSQKANSLQQSINTTSQQINDTQSQISDVEQSIVDKQAEITNTEAQLAAEKENQRQAIQTLYVVGGTDPLRMVLGSNSISDIVQQNQYLSSIETKVQMIIDEVNKTKTMLEQGKADLQKQQTELSRLKAQQESQKVNLAVQQQQTVLQKADATAQQQTAESQVKQLQQQIADIQKKLSVLISNARSGSDIVSGGATSWSYIQLNYSNRLGNSPFTVHDYGCLVTSLAMVSTYYGNTITPPQIAGHGEWFDRQGNAYTSTLASGIGLPIQSSGRVNWSTVDSELANGHPVIVSIYMSSVGAINQDGSSHFIVLSGKSGSTYIMQDPLGPGRGYSAAAVRSMILTRPQ